MDKFDLYRDIAQRTGGDIYVGVVGPVRTGKSTFIKKFMEGLVIDNIPDKNKRARTIDELPQSADGKTIMTTQPKFVPNEAVRVTFSDNLSVNMRMIDCVGYVIDGVMGLTEDGKARQVRTPWSDKEMPFDKAAELGTEKVIKEHSTIGIVVTTDGTIADIPREKYMAAEERVINELKELGKPFVVLLNTTAPQSASAQKIRAAISEKYGVPIIAKDVLNMKESDISEIMQSVLLEFPIKIINAHAPKWIQSLDLDSDIVKEMIAVMKLCGETVYKMRDYSKLDELFKDLEYFNVPKGITLDAGKGSVEIEFSVKEEMFFRVASVECGVSVSDEYDLLTLLRKLSKERFRTQKLARALEQVEASGYGVVEPTIDEMVLEEPVMVKQGSQYGVRLKASAPSLHIVRVDVETEVSPIVGSEQQSEDLVMSLLKDFETNKGAIWETNIFGKSLSCLVNEGLNNKLQGMPYDAQQKMRKALTRIINEGKGGVLCILL
ncbi:MAG: stage IV sporulation protein A [Clostridiales bacterium]|nr:stage IV sporulation protein A [Clostridiales bacterium]